MQDIGARTRHSILEVVQRIKPNSAPRTDTENNQLVDVLCLATALGLQSGVAAVQALLGAWPQEAKTWAVVHALTLLEDSNPLLHPVAEGEQLNCLRHIAEAFGCGKASTRIAALGAP